MKERIKLSILWIFSFIVIIFMMAFTSEAAVVSNTEIPYIVPEMRGLNTCIPNAALESAKIRYINDVRNFFGYQGDLSYLVFVTDGIINGNTYQIFFITNPSITETYPENYDYHNGFIKVNSNNVQLIAVNVRVSDNYVTGDAINLGTEVTLCGSSSTVSLGDGVLTSRYPFYLFGVDEIKSSNDVLIFSNETPPTPIDIGTAIIPPDAFVPDYPSGSTPPVQVPPTFTASDYNWTTPPTFDGSSIENAIGSIQNILGWIANNLKEEFKNLTNNLKGFFKYIGETIQYYGNAIISTLNNFIKNFYDNMKSLVEPIFQKIDYITTSLEADVIWDNISGTSLITNYSSIINAATSMKSSFENLSEPTDYKIPIHLEDLPSSWFGNLTTQYIDLGVINPVKNILRTFMWALITYSLFVTIIDSIANYINGGGDES